MTVLATMNGLVARSPVLAAGKAGRLADATIV